MFSLRCIDIIGTEFLCMELHLVKLVDCKSALNPATVYTTDSSKAVVPVLLLLCVALWLILRSDLQSNFDGSNIFGTIGKLFEIWVVRATEG